jgi:phasin
MKASNNRQVPSNKAGDNKSAAPFIFANEAEVPETIRALAETNVHQTRELYERSKHSLESVLDSWERTFDAAGQGMAALNRKVLEIAQRNINSGFDLAAGLAGAKNVAEAIELQADYWRKQFGRLGTQAEEVRSFSTQIAADVVKPMKARTKSENSSRSGR